MDSNGVVGTSVFPIYFNLKKKIHVMYKVIHMHTCNCTKLICLYKQPCYILYIIMSLNTGLSWSLSVIVITSKQSFVAAEQQLLN